MAYVELQLISSSYNALCNTRYLNTIAAVAQGQVTLVAWCFLSVNAQAPGFECED